MFNEFTKISINASETGKSIKLSFLPNDDQHDLKEQQLEFNDAEGCFKWLKSNWKHSGLDCGTGWMQIIRLMNDEGVQKVIRIALEALNNKDLNRNYFRLVIMMQEDNDAYSFVSFGQGSSIGEYKRTQMKALTKKLLVNDLTVDDLYVLFELELER